jgi:hypothetical protein
MQEEMRLPATGPNRYVLSGKRNATSAIVQTALANVTITIDGPEPDSVVDIHIEREVARAIAVKLVRALISE